MDKRSAVMLRWLKRKKVFLFGVFSGCALAFYALSPDRLFDSSYSTVVYAADGSLLGARVAADEQWRFPPGQNLPEFYQTALLEFEDKHFDIHPGIDPLALLRATKANLIAGKVVQGGSTITMQVVRMALENQPRTFWQKLKEMVLALRIELVYNKSQILQLYAAHAPFGGNVVGIDAAAWRYFGRDIGNLTQAEYALLAVLPNAPTALRPGKNTEFLIQKRNKLLKRLFLKGKIGEMEYELACGEPLPTKPHALPEWAPHFTEWANAVQNGTRVNSTLQLPIQELTSTILGGYHKKLAAQGVHNAALIVANTKTGEVLAYHGNTKAGLAHDEFVDIAQRPRSSGSILKPFLYGAMQRNGLLLPDELVVDIPTFISGFNPENYARTYDGMVPASDALARSLNVPAVRELKKMGVASFKAELQKLGFSTVNRSAENYGLSLTVGGAEVTLWDVCKAYTTMGSAVLRANYSMQSAELHIFAEDTLNPTPAYDAGAAYLTLKALQQHDDAFDGDGFVNDYAQRIAWKTGTSYGYRDAWAVGVTANFVVAVWIGNADGEGRPGVVGAQVAAPIMFHVFSSLGESAQPFEPPFNHLKRAVVCQKSGALASVYCADTASRWVANGVENANRCTYHVPVLLDASKKHRVLPSCATEEVQQVSWFVLPPACAYYYKKKHPDYQPLPPIAASCRATSGSVPMQLIYPSNFQKVIKTKQLDGSQGVAVFKLAHNQPQKKVFWHANEVYLGTTENTHEMPINLPPGSYVLRVVDEDGQEVTQPFLML